MPYSSAAQLERQVFARAGDGQGGVVVAWTLADAAVLMAAMSLCVWQQPGFVPGGPGEECAPVCPAVPSKCCRKSRPLHLGGHRPQAAATMMPMDLAGRAVRRRCAATSGSVPLAERLRPQHAGRGDRPAQHLLAPRPPAARGLRNGPRAVDDPVGPARRRQDHAGAAAGRGGRRAVHRAVGGAGRREGHPRSRGAGQAQRKAGPQHVVFVDEVHRFNKAQQDAFLPHVESGLFTFIGATTENPSFEVNSALLSRATVHVLKSAGRRRPGPHARSRVRGPLQAAPPLTPDGCAQRLVAHADGDARRLLNAYENLVAGRPWRGRNWTRPQLEAHAGRTAAPLRQGRRPVLRQPSRRCTSRCAVQRPRCRAVLAGAHARRRRRPALCWRAACVRMASRGHRPGRPARAALALDAAEVYERLGSPEGELALAEAVVYLAVAPSRTPSTRPGTRCATSSRRTAAARCPSACATRRPS